MAEGVLGAPHPQVFVVDSQASYAPLPSRMHLKRGGIGRWLLHLLVGLALFGVVVEAGFIYYLCNRMRQESGVIMGQMGAEETNEVPGMTTRRPRLTESQRKPSAHLMGAMRVNESVENVVLWENNNVGNSFTHNMDYKNGYLVVRENGYYYLYTKVHFSATQNCSSFRHKVMMRTPRYKKPLELMQSTRYHSCAQRPARREWNGAGSKEDLLNSFLGGVFHLQAGEAIFVELEHRKKKETFADDFMGAFMI